MALRQIASILAASLRQQDLAARLGGDEFALLLPNTDNAQAETVSRRLVEAVHAQTAVHISTGTATFDSDSVTDLLRVADRNLYKSKGRSQPRRRRARDAEGEPAATSA
jgi:diguanylate cyclase (GGDEF)-like protein